jgi:hypothetical protein
MQKENKLNHIKLAYNIHQCFLKFHAKGKHAEHAKAMETERLVSRANHWNSP